MKKRPQENNKIYSKTNEKRLKKKIYAMAGHNSTKMFPCASCICK